jgi:type IV pilus assembly protein PilA
MIFSYNSKITLVEKHDTSRDRLSARDGSGLVRTPSFAVRKSVEVLHAKSRNFLQSFINTKKLGVTLSCKGGFTLLEILLVVSAIAILAGIIIVAINPAKQLGDTRNAQRKVDVSTISNGVYQYVIQNGLIPNAVQATSSIAVTCPQLLAATTTEICQTGITGVGCFGRTDLSVLTTGSAFLVAMPTDPLGSTASGTGYYAIKNGNGRLVVCAPNAENNTTILIIK